MIFSDIKLSQKLERTEARVNADFVETRARLESEIGAEWIEVAGTYAMFDGVESPLTQTFGLGLFEDATDEHLDEIEAFFNERKAPVFHEVSPMTDPSLMELLSTRGYRPIELTSVMFRELDRLIEKRQRNESLTTRVISFDEIDLWARTSADGWATEHEGLADFMFSFGRIGAQCQGAFPYLAELDGNPISTGTLFIYDDVCALAGASTIPAGRNQGAQTALLEDRLEFAAEKGCKLAIMGASPGSQSQKNAQKNGFKIAYTRTKWQLRV
ncbi:MAG: GNAT family N-acetyltransferase [Chloracidobacterium sp.]|nr:GNAT family N-acetyltransferase [Chloracidobacterium sp.]